jgi:hypothetical protein
VTIGFISSPSLSLSSHKERSLKAQLPVVAFSTLNDPVKIKEKKKEFQEKILALIKVKVLQVFGP